MRLSSLQIQDLVEIPEAEFGEWPHVCMLLKDQSINVGRFAFMLALSLKISQQVVFDKPHDCLLLKDHSIDVDWFAFMLELYYKINQSMSADQDHVCFVLKKKDQPIDVSRITSCEHDRQRPSKQIHACLLFKDQTVDSFMADAFSRIKLLTAAIFGDSSRKRLLTAAMFACSSRIRMLTAARFACSSRIRLLTAAMFACSSKTRLLTAAIFGYSSMIRLLIAAIFWLFKDQVVDCCHKISCSLKIKY